MANLKQIVVVDTIHNIKDMLPNISRAAAQANGVKRMDFNSIKDAALSIKLIPDTVVDLMRIYSSLNYLSYKNNVEIHCLTREDGYIPLDKFIRRYLRVKDIKSIDLSVPYNPYTNKVEWKFLRYSLNQMKNILNPVYKDSTWNWVREYDTYDGTYVGACSEEEYGAQLVETSFSVQYVLEGVAVNLVAAPREQKFLLQYMKNKNFKFNTSVNGVLVERNTEEVVSLTEEQDRVLQSIKATFGDFDLECVKHLLIDLLVNGNLYSLDRWRFDENKFETDIMVIIHYVCKEDSDRELFYQNLLYEVMMKMDRHNYFIEPDERLYENEDDSLE